MKLNTSPQPDLSVVIPAYREGKRIGASLETLARYLKNESFFTNKKVEVVVVAADATDRTQAIATSKGHLFKDFTLLKPGPRVGKGRDVQYGMMRAHGRYVAFMDADLATPLHHLKQFYMSCEAGNDVAIGTRNLLKHHKNVIRRFISYTGNVLYRLAGNLWIEDSQCGFKMFTRQACELCFSRQTILGWGFDMEILAIAKANRLQIKAFRLDDWRDMPDSTFTDNILTIISWSFNDLGHIAINRMAGKYIQDTT